MEKIVGFVGYESEDIVIYLAKLLSAFGKKVAVIDRTEQEMLLEVLDFQEKNSTREGEFSGIWVTDQGVDCDEYDVVFYLFGYRLIHPKLYECETLIMVTDGVPAHASLLRKIGKWERKQYLVIRNLVPMRHTEQYLAMLADNEENYCEIPYDEQDIRLRCSLCIYSECILKRLSVGMRRSLELLICFIEPNCSVKQVREIMKKN